MSSVFLFSHFSNLQRNVLCFFVPLFSVAPRFFHFSPAPRGARGFIRSARRALIYRGMSSVFCTPVFCSALLGPFYGPSASAPKIYRGQTSVFLFSHFLSLQRTDLCFFVGIPLFNTPELCHGRIQEYYCGDRIFVFFSVSLCLTPSRFSGLRARRATLQKPGLYRFTSYLMDSRGEVYLAFYFGYN